MKPTRQLIPVPFTSVTIDDAFWASRIDTNRKVTIPAEYQMCLDTGRIAVFDLTWKQGDPDPPHIFWDSDVAKWIEAASYSLATHPDPALESLLDDVIGRISRAQCSDGYLNTHYTVVEPANRWTNLRDCHELYCAGHLVEAAVAHHAATGKRSLLEVLARYADYIGSVFGDTEQKKRGYCGHEEIELALVKLYHATQQERYLNLASYFIDERGKQPYYYDIEAKARGENPADFWAKTYAYMQSQIPVREQHEVTGHAVRAMYLYSAMADLALEKGDSDLMTACKRLWDDLCLKRMYITGGIGPSASNEGFTTHYDLPDETAYAETCAAVGLVFWNQRMLQLEGDGKFADVVERALYNGALSGVSLDGRSFFYVNPLASKGSHHRKGWFDCACCPPNIARLIASVGGYAYSQGSEDAWVHQYIQGRATLMIGTQQVVLTQHTQYPWSGEVSIRLELSDELPFSLNLRIPGWCRAFTVSINGAPCQLEADRGYLHLQRLWRTGDNVHLHLDMPVEYVQAHPLVTQMAGRVALQRGPIVYCLEGCDHDGIALDDIILRTDKTANELFVPKWEPDLLGGIVTLEGTGVPAPNDGWSNKLYRFRDADRSYIPIMAIPYCTWDNRAAGEMRVWFRT